MASYNDLPSVKVTINSSDVNIEHTDEADGPFFRDEHIVLFIDRGESFIYSCYACGRVVDVTADVEQTQARRLRWYALGQILQTDCDYEATHIAEDVLENHVGELAIPITADRIEKEMNDRLKVFADETDRRTVFTA